MNHFYDGLTEYRVSLHEDKGDKFTLFFDCWAEDNDHAEEQALDAYPNGEIINSIIKGKL
jgi:hypothetical protein